MSSEYALEAYGWQTGTDAEYWEARQQAEIEHRYTPERARHDDEEEARMQEELRQRGVVAY